MTASQEADGIRRAAIVGAGGGGLAAYVHLRYRGLHRDDMAVLDPCPAALTSWSESTQAIAQQGMRSESEGHFFATEFPGFALLDAVRDRSPAPLLRSVLNRYHPTLDAALRHGVALARHYDMEEQVFPAAVFGLERRNSPIPHFVLTAESGDLLVRARHVLLALGHGPWRWPEPLSSPQAREALSGHVYHSYQRKTYRPQRVVVIGAGMAAASEWANALEAGATVIALRRRAELVERPLTAPRCAFGGPWLDWYHSLAPDAREHVLNELSAGTFPPDRRWKRMFAEARAEGRLQDMVGELEDCVLDDDGLVRLGVMSPTGGRATVEAASVICATGFKSGWEMHHLTRELVHRYDLATCGRHMMLADDCSVPRLSSPESALVVSGVLSRWAYPPADSFAGMKFASRRFAEYVMGRPVFGPTRLASWWDMVVGGWPYGSRREDTETAACATP